MRRSAAVAAGTAIIALMSASPAGATAAKSCNGTRATKLFLQHGIHTVQVNNMSCRRAVFVLDRWADNGMRGIGPRRWYCYTKELDKRVKRITCGRRGKHMRFDVGGG
jgi:hypothetical protein